MMIDIGCGNHKVKGSIGVDIKKTSEVDILASVYELPFEDKTFDVAYLHEVIEHLDNPKKALKEIRRILKDDGILHITTPNSQYLFRLVRLFFNIKPKVDSEHINSWSLGELENLLRDSGFKIKSIGYTSWRHFNPKKLRDYFLFFLPKHLTQHSIVLEVVKDENFNGREHSNHWA